ncbi:MAG TPA: helix-turn-helix domain-containing protein [Hanamia sp.]|nr:helix-turn-helix domain-containing protein [Hanamia sp.]
MSSNIRVQKICQYCQKEFEARKTTSKTCSDYCAKMLYKQKQRALKIDSSNEQTRRIKMKPYEDLKAKEFLTVREVSKLLNCSIRTIYNYIDNGTIKAANLAKRITRVKRSEIDKLFE